MPTLDEMAATPATKYSSATLSLDEMASKKTPVTSNERSGIYQPHQVMLGYALSAGTDFHKGTPGVFDVSGNSIKARGKTLDQAAQDFRDKGYSVYVHYKAGTDELGHHATAPSLHVADPNVAPRKGFYGYSWIDRANIKRGQPTTAMTKAKQGQTAIAKNSPSYLNALGESFAETGKAIGAGIERPVIKVEKAVAKAPQMVGLKPNETGKAFLSGLDIMQQQGEEAMSKAPIAGTIGEQALYYIATMGAGNLETILLSASTKVPGLAIAAKPVLKLLQAGSAEGAPLARKLLVSAVRGGFGNTIFGTGIRALDIPDKGLKQVAKEEFSPTGAPLDFAGGAVIGGGLTALSSAVRGVSGMKPGKLELVETSPEKGTFTIRNKTTGEMRTLQVQKSSQSLRPDAPTTTIAPGKTYTTDMGDMAVERVSDTHVTARAQNGARVQIPVKDFRSAAIHKEAAPSAETPVSRPVETVTKPLPVEATTQPPTAPEAITGAAGTSATKLSNGELVAGENRLGLSRARIESQRQSEGLAPIDVQPFRAKELNYSEGKAAVDTGNIDPVAVAKDIIDNPRPATGTELGALSYRLDQIDHALKTGDPAKKEQLLEMRDTLQHGVRRSGREWSSTGHALQLTYGDETDLGNVFQAARDNKGRALTPNEIEQITKLHDKYDSLKTDYEKRISTLESQVVKGEKDPRAIRTAKTPTDFVIHKWGEGNTVVTSSMRDAARERLKAKMSSANAGIPIDSIADLAVEIAYHAEAGVRFTYESMRNYLKSEFDASDEDIQRAYQIAMNDKRNVASRKRLTANLARTGKAIEAGEPIPKMPPIRYDAETLRMRVDLNTAREKLLAMTKANSPALYARTAMAGILNAPTGWLAAWDNSFIGRQGLGMLGHNPKAWAEAFKKSHSAMFSEGRALLYDDAIVGNKSFPLAQQSGLAHTSMSAEAPLATAEEASMYMRTFGKVPGIGKLTRPFDRAYTTAANVIRHEAFYRMAEAQGDRWTPAQYKDYASLLNKLTGRGNLGRLGAYQPELNALFISIRKVASDVQLPLTVIKGDREVRGIAAKTLAVNTAALASLAMVINASGTAHVSLNPGDKDFMKVKIGNTRFDLLESGKASAIRATWKAAIALYKHSRFSSQKPNSKPRFNEPTALDIGSRYLSYKLAPGVGFARSVWTGKDFKGDSITAKQAAIDLITPWNVGDIADAYKDAGIGMAAAVAAATFYGLGTRAYEDKHGSNGYPMQNDFSRLRSLK